LDPLSLGLALTILGMGGTLLTLFVISLVGDLLKRLFPIVREKATESGATGLQPPTAP
jgi:Na+-transporting methylmalonyl-CoA/oxaloacetate decarboxylase gamma subunit